MDTFTIDNLPPSYKQSIRCGQIDLSLPELPLSKVKELMGEPDVVTPSGDKHYSAERLVQVRNSPAFEQAIKEQDKVLAPIGAAYRKLSFHQRHRLHLKLSTIR